MVLSEELQKLLALLDINVDQLAQVIRTDRAEVYAWLTTERFPKPGNESRQLDDVIELASELDEAFAGDGAAAWLHSPSGYFKGECPVNVLLRGDINSVKAALMALEYGAYI